MGKFEQVANGMEVGESGLVARILDNIGQRWSDWWIQLAARNIVAGNGCECCLEFSHRHVFLEDMIESVREEIMKAEVKIVAGHPTKVWHVEMKLKADLEAWQSELDMVRRKADCVQNAVDDIRDGRAF